MRSWIFTRSPPTFWNPVIPLQSIPNGNSVCLNEKIFWDADHESEEYPEANSNIPILMEIVTLKFFACWSRIWSLYSNVILTLLHARRLQYPRIFVAQSSTEFNPCVLPLIAFQDHAVSHPRRFFFTASMFLIGDDSWRTDIDSRIKVDCLDATSYPPNIKLSVRVFLNSHPRPLEPVHFIYRQWLIASMIHEILIFRKTSVQYSIAKQQNHIINEALYLLFVFTYYNVTISTQLCAVIHLFVCFLIFLEISKI